MVKAKMPYVLVRVEPELKQKFQRYCVDHGTSAQELLFKYIQTVIENRSTLCKESSELES